MGGEYRHDFTENLEAVARGVRRLEDIADPELRDAVRTALGLDPEGPGLDAARRARIRRIVLAAAPQGPRASDRAVGWLAVVAAPAPHAVRFLSVIALSAGLLAGATVASADSLPDDALYGVKIAAEQIRLALAVASEDRAAVELSLAEHRLTEAERLAGRGSESGALVATSAYAAHLASAAAELSQVEARAPRTIALIAQLESRLGQQRIRAHETAQRLLADPRTALAGAVLSTIATRPPGAGATATSRIAESAATVSARLSAVADDRARTPLSTFSTRAPSGTTPRPNAKATTRPTVDPAARIAAEKARDAAAKAKLAAERAKRTPTPKPTKTPGRR